MIKIRLFGNFAIFTAGSEISLPTNKARELAAYLFFQQGRPVRRDYLRGMLWGDVDEKKAAGSLRTALHFIRQALRDGGISDDVLEVGRYAVTVREGPQLHVDARYFEDKAAASLKNADVDLEGLIAAESVYGGAFLEDMHSDWCLAERQRLADIYVETLGALVDGLSMAGLHQNAVLYAHRWLDMSVLDEMAHQALMRLYVAMGQPARAARQFTECRRVLDIELGINPSDSTIDLFHELGLASCVSTGAAPADTIAGPRFNTGKVGFTKRFSGDPSRNAGLLLVYGEDKALQGEIEEGMRALRKALSIYKRLEDREGMAHARLIIASALLETPVEPQPREALGYIEPAFEYYLKAGSPVDVFKVLSLKATACWEIGQYEQAFNLAQEGLRLADTVSDRDSETRLLLITASVNRDQYRLMESLTVFDDIMPIATRHADTKDVLRIMFERSLLALLMADWSVAESLLDEMLDIISMLTPSPKVKQLDSVVRANLCYVHFLKGNMKQAAALCPSMDAETFGPALFNHLPALVVSATDRKVAIKVLSDWLRSNLSSLQFNYIEPLTQLISEQAFLVGLTREASQWTALGARCGRCKGWPGWAGVFYGRRATVLARQGKTKAAVICRNKAEQLREEADRWTLAWLTWAEGLIAWNEQDAASAEMSLLMSIDLFNELDIKFHRKYVEEDLKRLKAKPTSTPNGVEGRI